MLIKDIENISESLVKEISIQGKFGFNSFVYGLNTNKINKVKDIVNFNKMIKIGLFTNYNSGFSLLQYQYPVSSTNSDILSIVRTESIVKKLNSKYKIKYSDLITPTSGDPYTKVSYIYKDAEFYDTSFISSNIINSGNLKNTLNV